MAPVNLYMIPDADSVEYINLETLEGWFLNWRAGLQREGRFPANAELYAELLPDLSRPAGSSTATCRLPYLFLRVFDCGSVIHFAEVHYG